MSEVIAPTRVAGVLAEFDDAQTLLEAAAKVRDAGYRRFDVFTPYPVHGMDDAMGMGRSHLGWIVLICGISGIVIGYGLQWFTNAFDYPLVVAGKPYFSWQAFMVVTFEVMIGASAFGAVVGMLLLNGLPRWHHPLFDSDNFARSMDDGFFLYIESSDEKFSAEQARGFLEEIGGKAIEVIEEAA